MPRLVYLNIGATKSQDGASFIDVLVVNQSSKGFLSYAQLGWYGAFLTLSTWVSTVGDSSKIFHKFWKFKLSLS